MSETGGKPGLPAWPAAADRVLVRAWARNRPAATATVYARVASAFLAHCEKLLAEVGPADLAAWDEARAGQAPATRRRDAMALRSFFAFAREMGALETDPMRGYRAPAAPPPGTERILEESEVRRVLDGEPDPRRRLMLRLLYFGGLRASEAAAASVRDLTQRPKGGELRVLGKGGKVRTVNLPAGLVRDLAALGAGSPDSPLIPNRDGGRCDRFSVHRIVKRAVKRAGLPDASAHWLRHAHASHALDRGAPPQVVQQSLGHASLATTTRYSHARKGDRAGDYLPE